MAAHLQKIALVLIYHLPYPEKDFALRLTQAEREWAELSEAERRRRVHRNHISERILTLACPRCGQAFIGKDLT